MQQCVFSRARARSAATKFDVFDTKVGMLPDEMARCVLECDRALLIRDPDGEVHAHGKTLSGYIDSSAFADTGTGAVARGNRMNQLGCRWTPVVKTPEYRIQGVQRLHELLGTTLKDGLPQLRVFSSCVNLVKAIPTAPRDEDRPEDIDLDWPQDHLLDAVRYGLAWKDKMPRQNLSRNSGNFAILHLRAKSQWLLPARSVRDAR